ncbi:MAG: O-methyltransferase [Erysipelotrichaceae bacterium]
MIEQKEFELLQLEMEQYALKHDVPIIQREGLDFLTKFISEENVLSILEIGSAIGYSGIMMAKQNPNIKLVTMEIDPERFAKAKEYVNRADMENQIELLFGDALTIEVSGSFDLIFIDAAKAQYIKFFERYEAYLSKHGFILTDNLSFHGYVEHPELAQSRNLRQLVRKIQRYIDYLKEHTGYETTFYDLGDGIAISRKK